MTRRIEFYTPADVAERLKVSTATLFHWRRKGYGPEWFKARGVFLYSVADFNKYLHKLNDGHPIPDMTTLEKTEFFRRFHNPRVPSVTKANLADRIEKLADRVAVIEERLAKLTETASGEAITQPKLTESASGGALNQPKPKRQKSKRKRKCRVVRVRGVRPPVPAIPY